MSYFGLDGRLTLERDGYAIVRTVYDSRGNLTEDSFLDETGQPAHLKQAAKAVYTYNKYGWQIERRFYGVDGQLIKNPTSGRAIVRSQYDDAGRITSETSFDEHDAPVDRIDLKYFKRATTYDQTGKASEVCTTTRGRVISPCPKEN
jgi:YD repeat-containing protein